MNQKQSEFMKNYLKIFEGKEEKLLFEKAPSMQHLIFNYLIEYKEENPPEGCECIIFKQESKLEIKETGTVD